MPTPPEPPASRNPDPLSNSPEHQNLKGKSKSRPISTSIPRKNQLGRVPTNHKKSCQTANMLLIRLSLRCIPRSISRWKGKKPNCRTRIGQDHHIKYRIGTPNRKSNNRAIEMLILIITHLLIIKISSQLFINRILYRVPKRRTFINSLLK